MLDLDASRAAISSRLDALRLDRATALDRGQVFTHAAELAEAEATLAALGDVEGLRGSRDRQAAAAAHRKAVAARLN